MPVPRFYFHLSHGFKELPDPEGTECADEAAAIAQGVRTMLEMLTDDVRQGRIDLGWRMQIEDAGGRTVRQFTFSEVFGGISPQQPGPKLRQ